MQFSSKVPLIVGYKKSFSILVKNSFPVAALAALLGKVTVVTPTLAPQRCERMRVFVVCL